MRKILGVLAIAGIGLAAWFNDVEKQDVPHNNLLSGVNPGFENSTSKWVKTGSSTLAATTANQAWGVSAGEWNASASGEFLRSADVVVPKGLEGRACLMELDYWLTGGSVGDVTVRVETDGGDALTEALDLAVNGKYAKAQLGFICPTSDSIRIEFESTADASVLRVDQAYLGRDHRLGSQVNDGIIAVAEYAPTVGCDWANGGGGLGQVADTDCPAITPIIEKVAINTTDNNLPDIVFDDLPAGTYEVTATFYSQLATANNPGQFAWYDGSDFRGFVRVGGANNANEYHPLTLTAIYEHTGGAKTFGIYYGRNNSGDIYIVSNSGVTKGLTISVKKLAENATETVTLETQGWYVDANIGGANISLGLDNRSSYEAAGDAGLDLVNNNSSVPVGVPCSSTNEATIPSTTCSAGDEQIGVSFNAPYAGTYKFCTEVTHQIEPASDTVFCGAAWQMVETENNSQTIIQEGGSRVTSGFRGIQYNSSARNVCGVFNFESAGKKTIRLMREQICAGASGHLLIANRSAPLGQMDVHVYGYPITQQFPQAVALVGPVDTSKVYNSTQDEDFSVCVNDNGSEVCPIVLNGSAGTIKSIELPTTCSTADGLCSASYNPPCTASGVGASCSCTGSRVHYTLMNNVVTVTGICAASSSAAGYATYSIDTPLGGSFPAGSDGDYGGGIATFVKNSYASTCVSEQSADRMKCTVQFVAVEGTDWLSFSFSYRLP